MAEGEWKVGMEPIAGNTEEGEDEKNIGGIVIFLEKVDVDPKERREVSRVAFIRKHSKNPNAPFKQSLKDQLTTATEAADALNNADRIIEEAKKAKEEAEQKFPSEGAQADLV